jgi:outer membrane protein
MKKNVLGSLCLAAAATFLSHAVQADEFSASTGSRPFTLGLGILYKDKPYRGYDSSEKSNAVPLIMYEGENFFVRGGSLGWKFVSTSPWEVAVVGEYLADGYESSDSNYLRGMDDRDPSFGLGGHVVWKPTDLGFKLAAVTDVTDNSDGTQVRGEMFYTMNSGPWHLRPMAGVIWQDEDYNDYYYGVKNNAKEVNTSIGRTAYSADSDFNYRLGATLIYQQKESPWMFLVGARYDFLGDEISDSPIVSEDSELTAVAGFGYTFGK